MGSRSSCTQSSRVPSCMARAAAIAMALVALALIVPVVADAAAPVLTVSAPSPGATVSSSTPVFAGTSTDSTDPIVLTVFRGGSPLYTQMTSAPAGSWEALAEQALARGRYTLVAEQSSNGEAAEPAFVTFTVDRPSRGPRRSTR